MAPVYAAKYSNVPVWVSTVKNVSVMRRQGDGWVNATHLLKVADFDKPRRTRILERDVQTGEHEKVQGGYGKYQGTWIPVTRALELSEQVGILDLVHDLLVYVPQEGVATEELPRQPKAVGAPRKQNKSADAGGPGAGSKPKRARKINSVPGPTAMHMAPRAQAMQSMPPTMNNSYSQMHWPQYSPQSPYTPTQHMNPQQAQMAGMPMAGMHQMSQMPQYSMGMNPGTPYQHQYGQGVGLGAGAGAGMGMMDTHNGPGMRDPEQLTTQMASAVSSPSLSSSVLSSDGFSDDERPYLGGASLYSRQRQSQSSAEPAVAALRSNVGPSGMTGFHGSTHGETPMNMQGPSQYMADYSSKLLDFFMSPDKSVIPATLLHPQPGPHINQPIDDEGNTAFHWTCAIGRIELMRALLDAGADIKAINHAGQTPLVRAVMFTNNYEARTFSRVLELLVDTASYIDPNGRSILHHIAGTASSSSRSAGARYYAEIILAKLRSSPELVPNGFSAWLDHQDQHGDTALHIACRSDSRRLAKVLLSYHAHPLIPNKAGITSEDLLKRTKQKRGTASDKSQSSKGSDLATDAQRSMALTAANQASQVITGYLTDMAKTYDTDLANKDSDIAQVQELLDRVRQQASEIEMQIPKLQDEIGSSEHIQMETEKLEQDAHEKAEHLRHVLERSQARDLAIIVQKEETDIHQELKQQLNDGQGFSEVEQRSLARRLAGMQQRRQSLLDEIIVLYGNAGSLERIGKYRKLVANCCDLREEEVDNYLEGIAQALGIARGA